MISSSNKNNTSVEFTVAFDQDDFEPARLQALERLARNAKIPGFRNGKAPANVVEQHVDPNELANMMLDILVRRAIPKVFSDAKVNPISIPHVEVVKYIPGESAEVHIKADIMPEVKLADYKNLKSSITEPVITEADVDDVLNRIAENMAETKVVKREAKKGDEVIIDFKGLKDGVAFDGGTAKDYKLVLGSGQFIPGFEEALVGHGSGDKFNIDITFPKNYGVEDLAGKPVVFEILMKQVNEVVKPAIDDELAKKTGGFATLKELRADIKQNVEAQSNREAENRYKDDLLNELVDGSKTEAPSGLVDEQTEHIKEDMMRNLQARGMTLEDYLKQHNQQEADYTAEVRQAAERRVISSIIVQKLSEELKIEVSDAEVEQQVAEMRHVYKKDENAVKQLENPEVINGIRNQMRINATMDKLVEINKLHAKKVKSNSEKPKTAKKATKKTATKKADNKKK